MNKSLAIGALLFVVGIAVGRMSVLMSEPEPAARPLPVTSALNAEDGGELRGRVAEVIQVSQYTYLRL